MGAILRGELAPWPSKAKLAAVLHAAGLRIYVSRYSIRVEDYSHFSFEHYGGDHGSPILEADADSAGDMLVAAGRVSAALRLAELMHRFEIYDGHDEQIGYLHHGWPQMSM